MGNGNNLGFLKNLFRKAKTEDTYKDNNVLLSALYNSFVNPYDPQLSSYIKNGWAENTTVYGLLGGLSTLFKGIKWQIVEETSQGDKIIEDPQHPLNQLITIPNPDTSMASFKELCYLFYLATGNWMNFIQKYESGNYKGQIDGSGLQVIPPQYAEAHSGGWKNPIEYYTLTIDSKKEKLEKENVLHIKMPNLDYDENQQLMGKSPLSVAAKKIVMLNASNDFVASSYKRGLPPGIIYNNSDDVNRQVGKEQQNRLERAWEKKYGNQSTNFRPILTNDKLGYIQLGFSSMRDLMILELSQEGKKELAAVLNVPPAFIGDTSASTYNNVIEGKKIVYSQRIIPDDKDIRGEFNRKIAPLYAKEGQVLKIEADYSDIEAMKEDEKEKTNITSTLVKSGVISINEARQRHGLDTLPGEEYNIPSVMGNQFDVMASDEINKWMDEYKNGGKIQK